MLNANGEDITGARELVAAKMLDLITDLGDCVDSRQILVAATRRFRQLFGDYNVFALLLNDPASQTWTVLPLENPYGNHWGGLGHDELPEATDTDELTRNLGRNVTSRIVNDALLHSPLIDQSEPFSAVDNVLAVRMAGMIGSPSRSFLAASWKRASADANGWLLLGYADAHPIPEEVQKLFVTAVEVTGRMALYPTLIDFVNRTEKINLSIRRNIVHDLKTPLTVIRGYADTLQHPEIADDPEMRAELLSGIVESTDRLLVDLKDILEPVDKSWTPAAESFDLAMVVHKAVMAERHTERSRNHEIELTGADHPISILGDLRKVRRVIENLLSNAVKYSPGVGKHVLVNLVHSTSEVAIVVQDQGLGMTAEQLEKVMSNGGRVVDATLGIEGSGFGLDSTRRVLTAHGGRLEAKSTPGQGSTFVAFLPIS